MGNENESPTFDGTEPSEKLPLDVLGPEAERDQTRRRFIRLVGGSVFALAVLDIPDIGANQALAQSGGGCGSGTADQSCSGSNNDENCGLGTPVDQDNSCSSLNNDESCNSAPGDYDQSCSSSNNDEACGQGSTQSPTGKDPDATCSSTNSDEGCSISQVPAPSNDGDQNCNATNADADQACGDCDDNHDSDEHCGRPLNGATDADDLCGHQHWVGHDEDDTCSATTSDQGCGTHTTVYGGTDDDPDQHCVNGNADMHCTAPGPDSNCDAATNPSTTSPDETCGAADPDQACGHYDADESCSATAVDQACGEHFGVFGPTVDTDQNCTAQGGTNATDNTGHPHTTL